MKLLVKWNTSIALLWLLLASACGGDSSEMFSEEESVKKLLIGAWNLNSATVDGSSTEVYNGLSLTFTSTTVTAVKGEPLWPATSTWTFVDETAKTIKRSDGLIIDIISITEVQLKLGLTWTKTTMGGGRVSSIAGKHVLTFNR
jgi:hypothetical protein